MKLLILLAALCAARSPADQRNDRGVDLAQAEKYEEAIPHFEAAIAADPRNFRAYSNLGQAHAALERHDRCEKPLRQSLELSPKYDAAHSGLARCLNLQARLPESEDWARRALALREDADNLLMMAIAMYYQDRPAEGLPFIEKALRLAPKEAGLHAGKAQLLLAAERGAEALESARAAVVVSTRSPAAFLALGMILARQGDYAEAEKALDEAERLGQAKARPRNPFAMPVERERALLQLARGQRQAAARHLKRYFELRRTPLDFHGGPLRKDVAAAARALGLAVPAAPAAQ